MPIFFLNHRPLVDFDVLFQWSEPMGTVVGNATGQDTVVFLKRFPVPRGGSRILGVLLHYGKDSPSNQYLRGLLYSSICGGFCPSQRMARSEVPQAPEISKVLNYSAPGATCSSNSYQANIAIAPLRSAAGLGACCHLTIEECQVVENGS